MTTSHRADGPGSPVLPGPGARAIAFANNNGPAAGRGAGAPAGLVLALETGPDGRRMASIRLMDTDGRFAEPVLMTSDLTDVVAFWRGLGRLVGLDLYLREPRGMLVRLTPSTGVSPHRRGSALSGRRPRFLVRRKVPTRKFRPLGCETGAR